MIFLILSRHFHRTWNHQIFYLQFPLKNYSPRSIKVSIDEITRQRDIVLTNQQEICVSWKTNAEEK